jgi:FkbM family methyltransferase
MEHCFDTGPILQVSSLHSEENICIIDPLSELLAKITKQLIQNTSGSMVDVGAYRGKWADYVYNNCPDSMRKIYLFEPSMESYAYIAKKYRGLSRFQFHNLALSSSRKNLRFIEDQQSSKVYVDGDDYTLLYNAINVPSIKYDSIFKDKHIAIVKIRTNGHEINVLSGMQESMQENKVESIIFECNAISYGFHEDTMYIHKYLPSLKEKFKYIYAIEREYLKTSKIETNNEMKAFMYSMNLLDAYDIVCCNYELKID